jgi:preprotein translocase subunit SecB
LSKIVLIFSKDIGFDSPGSYIINHKEEANPEVNETVEAIKNKIEETMGGIKRALLT